MFDMRCKEHGIEHRLTKIKYPWSHEDQKTARGIVFPNGGQVKRMNRTIKDATVKRFHYDDHEQLRRHLADFIDAYNFGQRLKALRGLTPDQFIVKSRTSEPEQFTLDPTHQMPELIT
jgi:Integrase core domain